MASDSDGTSLDQLAAAAGVARDWRDVDGVEQRVSDENLRAVLASLGHRCETDRQARQSLAEIGAGQDTLPALLVADAGRPLALTGPCRGGEIVDDGGRSVSLAMVDGVPIAPDRPGYYDILIDGQPTRLAVAPPHCPLPRQQLWGPSVQIPALRGSHSSSFGTFADLADAVEVFARHGAGAVAINPVHALFPGNGVGFSPYSPSSRRFLNGAMGDPALLSLPPLPNSDGGDMIDWESAMPRRLQELRASYAALPTQTRQAIAAETGGDGALRQHAIFDALDCRYRPGGARGWRDWPTCYRNPANAAVARFADKHADEVAFHLFVQWLARGSLAEVQRRAKAAGMATGLVGDLAVGVDPGGSDAWSLGDAMLRGLTIGAPPDPLGPLGQNWALTSFSPDGLHRTGYAPWIAMIRAALAHGGGLRIDHAFGLARLWVIPEGGDSSQGAYLSYPFADLVRLLTLEAHLADSFVIAEDLGTAPHGFTAAIAQHRMPGMRVLWFQRAEDHGFIGAQDYDVMAAAMTGTHDTPTLAGWWRGTDLDWAARLGRLPADTVRARAEDIRDWDRGLLWSTIAGTHPRPAPDETGPAVDAGIAHIARTPSVLKFVPLEDICGLEEQPNLPGTVTEHPNWRRRLGQPTAELLAAPPAAARMHVLNEACARADTPHIDE